MIKKAKLVVLDGNLSTKTIEYLLNICNKYNINVWYETISIEKSIKIIKNSKILNGITYISPNELELYELINKSNFKGEIKNDGSINELKEYLKHLINGGIKNVILSRGNKGVLIARKNNDGRMNFNEIKVDSLNSNEILNTNGAGDNLVGGTIVGLLNGKSLNDAIKIGINAASLCLKTHKAVNPKLNDLYKLSKL